jgi:subtilase family serine protease
MNRITVQIIAGALWPILLVLQSGAAETQTLTGHVPKIVQQMNLKPVGRLPAGTSLDLQIGLRLRDPEKFTNLFAQLYNPASPQFHHWLTPQQIGEKFGPDEKDYQMLINFARTNGLKVTRTQFDHTLLSVNGSVEDIEKAFHVKMQVYNHPVKGRTFYASDVEPSLELSVPILHISNLANYTEWRDNAGLTNGGSGASVGTGPGGGYIGYDMRNAYLPNVKLDGSGQTVALFSRQLYFSNDIASYEATAGLPSVHLSNIFVGTFNPPLTNGSGGEISVDIEMAISMAPGLSEVYIYAGFNDLDTLKMMQTDNLASQMSTSFGLHNDLSADVNYDPIFMMMGIQGISFFEASGDGGAFYGTNTAGFEDTPYTTVVGGTSLMTASPGGAWASETAWVGSGGGPSPTLYPLPAWQQGINMSAIGGSPTLRNVPDVAMVASNMYNTFGNGMVRTANGGTSFSTPLWAGLTAVINEQAANQGLPSVGFLNPTLYAIGAGPLYAGAFHDITVGNNATTNGSVFYATNGYDLVTGWGTPNGMGLITAILAYSAGVWVDFNYTGGGNNGTFNNPYTTVAQGTNAVLPNGTIWIRSAGSTHETMTITKPMTIRAYNGAATIGN